MNEIKELNEFIEISEDVREIKRGLAVKMRKQGHKLAEVEKLLNISASFVSKWKKKYEEGGVEELKMGFEGSEGYLTKEQRGEIQIWLRRKEYWNLEELKKYVDEEYGVSYKSKQSYYDLFHAAGISWKKKPEKESGKQAIGSRTCIRSKGGGYLFCQFYMLTPSVFSICIGRACIYW